MRLTQHTDYALRVLISLAVAPEGRHTVETVARRHDLSRNHLMKVAQTLTQAGFVEGTRGRNGGIALARRPEAIRLGAVVRACEDNFTLVDCFDAERNRCLLTPACGLRGPLEEALAAFLHVLDGYTLADLIARPGQDAALRRLVFPSPDAGAQPGAADGD